MDIVERLRELKTAYEFSKDPYIGPEAASEIEQLREALLDTVAFVSRADSLFLRKATTNTLKGIPDGYR